MATTDLTGPVLQTAPCWVLADASGQWEERHWATREAAAAELGRDDDPDRGCESELRQAALPCRVATAACGYVFDQEGEGVQHLPADLAEAEEWLFDSGWVRLPDGRWACGDETCQCVALLGDEARPRPRLTNTGPKWTAERLEGIDV